MTKAARQQKTGKKYKYDCTFSGQTSTKIVIQVKRICDTNREEKATQIEQAAINKSFSSRKQNMKKYLNSDMH